MSSSDWLQRVQRLPLPRTLDRCRATLVFFDIRFPSFLIGNPDARKWTSWAAISALTSVTEIVELDLEPLGLVASWRVSDALASLRTNKTLTILKELRNFEMHLEFLPRKSHTEVAPAAVAEPLDHNSVFFAALDWGEMNRLRNVRSRRSGLVSDDIVAFNELATQYSVRTIVEAQLAVVASCIASFVAAASAPRQLAARP